MLVNVLLVINHILGLTAVQGLKTKFIFLIANGNFASKLKVKRLNYEQNSSVEPNFEKIFYYGNKKKAKLK